MICEKCGKEISDDLRFCIYCGAPVVSKEPELDSGWECGSCGAPLSLGDKFCCACGTPVAWDDDDTDPAAAVPVSWEPAEDASGREDHLSDWDEEDYGDSVTVTLNDPVYDETDDETGDIEALIPRELSFEESDPEEPSPGLKGDLKGGHPSAPSARYGKLKHFKKPGDF